MGSLILQELDFADLEDKNESGDHIKQSEIKSPVKLSISSIMETALPKSQNQGKDLMQKSPFRTQDFLKSSPGGSSAKFDSPQVRRVREEITPMPDYAEMLSPALRIELRRFGLKVIPRRNAVPLLRHIYEETQSHKNLIQEELSLSQESNVSTVSEDFPEESIIVNNDDDPNELINDNNIHENLLNFIRQNQELHRQVLMYEPLWLEDLVLQFKDSKSVEGKFKVKINQVQEILDIECITFRTRARNDKNVKRNAKSKTKSPKKKNHPKKQPSQKSRRSNDIDEQPRRFFLMLE